MARLSRTMPRQSSPSGGGQPPPSDADGLLEQLAREFGLDPSQLGGAGQANPYGIFLGGLTGEEQVVSGVDLAPPGRVPIPPNLFGREREAYATAHRDDEREGVVYSTSGDLLKAFYKMTPSVLRRMQALLFAGGFYGNLEVTDVPWGEHDEASFAAWAQAIARTARINAAGRPLTHSQVISEAATAAGLDPGDLAEALEAGDAGIEELLSRLVGGEEEEGRVIDILLSDPNSLRATMDRASSAVLGRKSNAAEQRMFISMIHGLQRQGQIARQTAEPDTVEVGTDPAGLLGIDDSPLQPGDVITEFAPPDEGATAEALARQENPAEAGAHDIALQFAAFLDMLPAPVNVPRVTL